MKEIPSGLEQGDVMLFRGFMRPDVDRYVFRMTFNALKNKKIYNVLYNLPSLYLCRTRKIANIVIKQNYEAWTTFG